MTMKKLLYLLIFICSAHFGAFAQDEQDGSRVRERMVEYIESKLSLSKSESERFVPVFINYFKELRQTNQQYRNDRLVLQQKIAELRLRYRDQFKPIIGEKRSNDVFVHEREFVQKVKEERDERMQKRKGGAVALKRFKPVL
jgi:hypothetical protein